MPAGYLHPDYAASFAEFATPRPLPDAGGWLLERAIPGTEHRDAMGCYPLFCCDQWPAVGDDIAALAGELVSVVIITEPFAPTDGLEAAFDTVTPYKDHYVADLEQPVAQIVTRSHRAAVRRAAKTVDVHVVDEPSTRLDRWVELWEVLKARHSITGHRAFSRRAFEIQLGLPGMVMFEARCDGATVGLDLWYVQGDVAYGHLVAFDEIGYANRASYATKWAVLEHFAADEHVRWVDLGGSAGGGLAHFKQGWSNTTRPTRLCGRILQPDVYERLGGADDDWFPAYRSGSNDP